MGITSVNYLANLRENLSMPNLPDDDLQKCLNKVEAIVTNIAFPAIDSFNQQRSSLEEMFNKLNSLRKEEHAKYINHNSALETQRKLAMANDRRLETQTAKRNDLLIAIDNMTQKIAKNKQYIDENTSMWKKHKWTIITVGAIGVTAVTGVGLWAAGAFAGKALVGAVSAKAVGLLAAKTASAHAVGSTAALAANAAATATTSVLAVAAAGAVPAAPVIATATAGATPRAVSAARGPVEMQTPQVRIGDLENFRSSLDQLRETLDQAKRGIRTTLNTYYPTPNRPYMFPVDSNRGFVKKLNSKSNSKSNGFPPNKLMNALYEMSFVHPANPIISRLYQDMIAGSFETLAARLQSSIKLLEEGTTAGLFSRDKKICLSNRGKIFLGKALTLKWVLDKIEQAGNQMSNLAQAFEQAVKTKQEIIGLQTSQQTAQGEIDGLITRIAAQTLELNDLERRITILEENNKSMASELNEVTREAERIRAELRQRVG